MSGLQALDPRIERSRQRVLEAALAELGAAGYGAFAIERVAARSGVAKSTIYRHWPGKLPLVADAFGAFHRQQAPDISSGTPRERLARIVRHVAETVAGPPFSACIPALIEAAERDPQLRAFHLRFQAEARRPLVAVIGEVLAEANSTADADQLASALLGAIFYARLMTAAPFDPARADDLISAVLGASRAE